MSLPAAVGKSIRAKMHRFMKCYVEGYLISCVFAHARWTCSSCPTFVALPILLINLRLLCLWRCCPVSCALTNLPPTVRRKKRRFSENPVLACRPIRSMRGRIQPARLGGAISVIFGSQVWLRVHYYKRDEVYCTTLLWQHNGRQNGPKSRNAVCRIVQNHAE